MPKPTTRRNPLTSTANPVQTISETVTLLPLANIDRSGGTQIRLRLDKAKVTEYAELIKEGLLPIHGTVFYDGTTYWLGDGFHRVAAIESLSPTRQANVEVRSGTRRDAVLYAATQANNKHGLPLTKEDKQNAALTLLRDKEWGEWGDREIARKVGISHPTVGTLRKQVEQERAALSGNNYQTPTERKVIRGGTEYTMQTDTINRSREIRTITGTWLHQRGSDDKARRHMLTQLIEGSSIGKFLWKGLLSFIPFEVDAEDVTPILKAMLQELEETATVEGTEYQQAKIEEKTEATPSLRVTRITRVSGGEIVIDKQPADPGQSKSVTPAQPAPKLTPKPAQPPNGKLLIDWTDEDWNNAAAQSPAPTQRQRQDAHALRQTVIAAQLHLATHPNRLAVETLGKPFGEIYRDILTKLKALQVLLQDQYPE